MLKVNKFTLECKKKCQMYCGILKAARFSFLRKFDNNVYYFVYFFNSFSWKHSLVIANYNTNCYKTKKLKNKVTLIARCFLIL